METIDRFAKVADIFDSVRVMLTRDWGKLSSISTTKQLSTGTDTVLTADLQAEQLLVPELHRMFPCFPVLCEEAENSKLADLSEGIKLLPYQDNFCGLPQAFISVDGLDGSACYLNGELSNCAISVGIISSGLPDIGIVMLLSDNSELYHVGVDAFYVKKWDEPINDWQLPKRPLNECLIGTDDNKAVDDDFRQLVINRLTSSKDTKYPQNVPTVTGGIKVLKGNYAAYATSNAHHWDVAGVAALLTAANMIVRCLDGSPVPWNKVRIPPIVFARDEEAFEYVQGQAEAYLKH